MILNNSDLNSGTTQHLTPNPRRITTAPNTSPTALHHAVLDLPFTHSCTLGFWLARCGKRTSEPQRLATGDPLRQHCTPSSKLLADSTSTLTVLSQNPSQASLRFRHRHQTCSTRFDYYRLAFPVCRATIEEIAFQTHAARQSAINRLSTAHKLLT